MNIVNLITNNWMIYLAVVVGIALRILIQRGSFVLPTVYKEGNNVRFNFGTLGVIVVSIIAVFTGGLIDISVMSNPFVAFITAYGLPALVDGAATKVLPGSDDLIISEEIEVSDEGV